jgi:hypoxanthine phosphoribosyltransferase
MREEVVTWTDLEKLIDHLVPQIYGTFDALVLVTRGGIVPGGMIAEVHDVKYVMTAAVRFPDVEQKLLAWPTFLQFPEDDLLRDRRVLVVDDVWGSGRTINSVRGRVEAAGGRPEVAVLHYKPGESLFSTKPEYYAAVTDAYVVYPWEKQRGIHGMRMFDPSLI